MSYDVAVVGAGIAGLTAAYVLKKEGFNVMVLEQEDRPGGRVRTEREAGFCWDVGAQFLSGGYVNILALLKSQNLTGELIKLHPTVGFVYKGGVIYSRLDSPFCIFGVPEVTLIEKLKCLRVFAFNGGAATTFPLPVRVEASFPDHENLAVWSRRELGRGVFKMLLEPVISSLFFCHGADVSAAMFPFIRTAFLQARRPLVLRGGMDGLPLALAGQVEVRLGARVLNLVPAAAESGVEVIINCSGREGPAGEQSVRARRVVLAVPAPQALSLVYRPEKVLGMEAVSFLNGVRYTGCVTLGLAFNRPLDEGVFGISYPQAGGWSAASVVHEHGKVLSRVPPGKGFSLVMSTGDFYRGISNISSGLIEELLYQPVEAVYPGFSKWLEFTRLHHWELAMPSFGVGYLSSLSSFRARPRPNSLFSFCGDYMAGPCLEAAAFSGILAAEEVKAAF